MSQLRKTLASVKIRIEYMDTKLIKSIGNKNDQWPIIENLWGFYGSKGIKTVFLNVGGSSTSSVELEIAEILGCPIHTWDAREDISNAWQEVKDILKARKRPDTASAFSEGADSKWVLPKNIHNYTGVLSFMNGAIEIQGKMYPTVSLSAAVKQMILPMKVTEERIDILKLCLGEGIERNFLYSLMDSPYRPGILLVQWTTMPDSDLQTTICAGHLQNCGYTLMAKIGYNFLYMFNSDCIYEICSWESNKYDNPIVAELTNAYINSNKSRTVEIPNVISSISS